MGRESFDYVIVGAGSAGAVIASRLTESPGVSVLLLEAGGAADADEVSIPAAFSSMFKTRWDWNYSTTEQKQLHGRRAYWPRMRALGGCSSMNAMIYIRGNRADYDGWRDAHGAVGWGYDDVLPYFVRAEGNTRLGAPYHGQDGPLHVEDRRYNHPLSHAWVESAIASGLKPNDDFNGAEQEGAGLYQVTCKKGRRWSTAKAYLEPAADRPNLTIRTKAFATKVVIEGGRAVGVAYEQGNEQKVAYADAEVILSGGAINSPQVLMLSGIGPAEHLREHGVEVLHDLPEVGKNLQDHVSVTLRAEMQRGFSINDQIAGPRLAPHVLNYLLRRKGLLTLGASQASAFLRSGPHVEHPDLQINFRPLSFAFSKAGKMQPDRIPAVTASVVHLRPQSTGRVWLASRDPSDAPKMVANYLSTAEDRRAILAGVRWGQRIFGAAPLRERMSKPLEPTSDATDEALLAFSRARAASMCHPVSTCRMGGDEGSVVDPRLRVRGVENLRVVDASIMPDIVSGNTNAPAIMIGERGAALILEDAKAG